MSLQGFMNDLLVVLCVPVAILGSPCSPMHALQPRGLLQEPLWPAASLAKSREGHGPFWCAMYSILLVGSSSLVELLVSWSESYYRFAVGLGCLQTSIQCEFFEWLQKCCTVSGPG